MIISKESVHVLISEMKKDMPLYMHMYGMRLFQVNTIKTILDIGANCGLYSTAFRFFQPKARIISIEPDKDNYKDLVSNTSNLDIETFNVALGDGNEVSKITSEYSVTHQFRQSSIVMPEKEKCCSLLLNDMIESYKIDTNGLFIKIDTEGGEIDVLIGGFSVLSKIENLVIIIEVHPENLSRAGSSVSQLIELLG